MENKASALMREEVLAGVTLEAQQSVQKTVGGLVGNVLARKDLKPTAIPGDHRGIHYVAVGPSKIGFFSMKRGLFKPSLDELLVEHPRDELQTLEIKGGAMPAAVFVFQDGTNYVLMCPRIHLGKLKKVQQLLTGQ